MRRRKMNKRKSKKLFKRTANKMNYKNVVKTVPRGGIAL